MKRHLTTAVLMFCMLAAAPSTRPESTFSTRAEDYLTRVSWMKLPKSEQTKIRAQARAVDEAVAGYLKSNEIAAEVATAMYEGRIIPGMPEAALEIIIQPYRGHLTQTEQAKQYECVTRNPGDESRYSVTIQTGRVTAVSSVDH